MFTFCYLQSTRSQTTLLRLSVTRHPLNVAVYCESESERRSSPNVVRSESENANMATVVVTKTQKEKSLQSHSDSYAELYLHLKGASLPTPSILVAPTGTAQQHLLEPARFCVSQHGLGRTSTVLGEPARSWASQHRLGRASQGFGRASTVLGEPARSWASQHHLGRASRLRIVNTRNIKSKTSPSLYATS